MNERKTLELTCTYRDAKTNGQGTTEVFADGERMMRAMQTFSIGSVVTVGCLLVPILHFVLVPLALVLTILITYSSWAERGRISSAKIPCPNCATENIFENESDNWPKERRCPNCGVLLTFTKT